MRVFGLASDMDLVGMDIENSGIFKEPRDHVTGHGWLEM